MTLFPKKTKPYLVVAPSWTHKSSGVQTLHLLVHALNEAGQFARLIPENPTGYATNPFLNTPVLFPQHQNFFQSGAMEPIVVYPDTMRGNPLCAKHVIRMLLAPRGLYGGDKEFPETDQIWGALPSIADNVLRLPVTDTSVFFPPEGDAMRMGACFYSHKYDRIHGNKLLPLTDGFRRLEGSPEELAEILRTSEVCYLYEPTATITEAALCRCPVKLIRSEYFNKIDPASMMGNVQWNDGEVVRECDDYLPEYMQIFADFEAQLVNFIQKSQEIA